MADQTNRLLYIFDGDARGLNRAIAEVTASAGVLRGALSQFFPALAAGGLVAMAKSSIDAADALNDMSTRTGVSVRDLASLKTVAEQNDTSLEGLAKTLLRLNRAIGDASSNEDMANALKDLGVTARDPKEALFQLADGMVRIQDPGQRAALLAKVLGKNYAELLPMLNLGGAALRKAAEDSESFADSMARLAPEADKFNDAMATLKNNAAGVSASLLSNLVPAFNQIIEKMKEAGKQGSVLLTMWAGVQAAFDTAFNGTAIKQAQEEVRRLQDVVIGTQKKLAEGKAPIPFLGIDIKFNDQALATLRKNYEQQKALLGAATARLQALQNAALPQPKLPPAVVPLRSDVAKLPKLTRLPELKTNFDAELALTKSALDDQSKVLETALAGQLIDVDSYWTARRAIALEQLDLERRDLEKKIGEQHDLLARLSKVKPDNPNQAEELKGRIQTAQNKLAELNTQLTALGGKKITTEFELKVNADNAKRAIDDAIFQAKDELAKLTGTETDAQRREAVAIGFRDILSKLPNTSEAEAFRASLNQLIDVKTWQANLDTLQKSWQLAMQTMQNAEQSIDVQQKQGLITEADAQARIAQAHRDAGVALDALLPKMEALANSINSPEMRAAIAAWKNELASVKAVIDPIAASINTDVKNSLTGFLTDIGSAAKTAREAWRDLYRNILLTINKAASQRIVDSLFPSLTGGGGFGGFISGLMGGGPGGQRGGSPLNPVFVQDVSSAASAVTSGSVFNEAGGANMFGGQPGTGGGGFSEMFASLNASISNIVNGISSFFSNLMSSLMSSMGGIFKAIGSLFGFAEGGYTGAGDKDQPAGIVHAGEYVFNRAAVSRYGIAMLDHMQRLASGAYLPQMPRIGYAEGGLVNLPAVKSGDVHTHVRNVNVFDTESAAGALGQTRSFERAVLNVIKLNPRIVKG